jgi:CRP/FNR family cyclic AMP-dependent transcriptional regulator
VIDLESRRVEIAGIVHQPHEAWMKRLARNSQTSGVGGAGRTALNAPQGARRAAGATWRPAACVLRACAATAVFGINRPPVKHEHSILTPTWSRAALAPNMAAEHAAQVSVAAELLGRIQLFSTLDERELTTLGERVEIIEAPAGATLFHTGDPGSALYVLLEGEVELFMKNATGDRMLLERLTPGAFFGEISLLDGGPRTASALCTQALRAIVVDRGDLEHFLAICPTAAIDLLSAMGRRLRETSRVLRASASRNVNTVTEDTRTVVQRAADWISEFSGSLPFLFIHVVLFAVWIALNLRPLSATGIGGWDAYPFGLLTMSVSLEAIILSVFVLLSQNRQVARDRVRNDIEYDINLKAELEIAHLHEKVDRLYEQTALRLSRLEPRAPS